MSEIEQVIERDAAVGRLVYRESQAFRAFIWFAILALILAAFVVRQQVVWSNQVGSLTKALQHSTDQEKANRLAAEERTTLLDMLNHLNAQVDASDGEIRALQEAVQELLVATTPAQREAAAARLRDAEARALGTTTTSNPSRRSATTTTTTAPARPSTSPPPPSSTTTTTVCSVTVPSTPVQPGRCVH